MVIQRLLICAAAGKLQVVPVWQCLARSGARVCCWSAAVDRGTGMESIAIDVAADCDPQSLARIVATLGAAPWEMTVTLLNSVAVSNPEGVQGFRNVAG